MRNSCDEIAGCRAGSRFLAEAGRHHNLSGSADLRGCKEIVTISVIPPSARTLALYPLSPATTLSYAHIFAGKFGDRPYTSRPRSGERCMGGAWPRRGGPKDQRCVNPIAQQRGRGESNTILRRFFPQALPPAWNARGDAHAPRTAWWLTSAFANDAHERGTNLKITGLKTFIVGNPPPMTGGRYFIFLKLVTDSGIEGVGE